jgi:protein-tyrosine phosphatase
VIDLHCHILPALDDGAADLEDSLGMARQAEEDGIELVCATPHIRHDHDVLVRELPGRADDLNEELRQLGLRVRVSAAGEVAQTAAEGLDEDELRGVSLDGHAGWVLLEPAPGPLSDALAETVDALRRRGCRSVIAHPERHLVEDFEVRLEHLVGRGALVQVTAALLEHEESAPGVARLVRRGLVHLLGSDSHSSRHGRPVRLSRGAEALRRDGLSAEHVDWIVREAPAAVVRGEDPGGPPD